MTTEKEKPAKGCNGNGEELHPLPENGRKLISTDPDKNQFTRGMSAVWTGGLPVEVRS